MQKRIHLPPSLNRLTPARIRADRLEKYEHKVVKFILSRYGLYQSRHEIERTVEQATGARRLTFDAFEQFHVAPVILRTQVFDRVADIFSVASLLGGRFTNSPIIEEYCCLRDRWPNESRPIALVFHFPGLRDRVSQGNLALHNMPAIDKEGLVNTCICQTRRVPKTLLVVEPLIRFLEGIWPSDGDFDE